MHTRHPSARSSDRPCDPVEFDREPPDPLLLHVPKLDLQIDRNCTQDGGVDLPVVVVNLLHRSDRWQTVTQRMSAIGLTKLIRVPAIEGARLPDTQIATLLGMPNHGIDKPPGSHLALTRPAIGCFLTHLAIWCWMIRTGLPRILVLEDDVAPATRCNAASLRNLVASMPSGIGFVLLGRTIMGGLADRPQGSNPARIYYFNGTFAYLVTASACQTLLRHLFPLRAHIDHQISKVLIEQRHVFHAYYTEPPFFEHDWSLRSDCNIPLNDDTVADRELAQIIEGSRRILLDEGRPLLSA
jgi:glycosyl transferase, family 25